MKVVYLVQTASSLPQTFRKLKQTPTRALVWLTYERKAEGALFLPNSTWTEGRNRLLREAVQLHPDFDYLTFCDDDIEFTQGSWIDWEEELAVWRPLIASPTYPHPLISSELRAHTLYNFDGMMNAFHRTCLSDGVILPYIEKYDRVTWWLSQFFLMHFANALYPGKIAKFGRIQIVNPRHGEYPRIAESDFAPFASVYLRDGWRDPTPATATYRFFNDLTGEVYLPFQASDLQGVPAHIYSALAIDGPLLGSRGTVSTSARVD